MRIHVQYRSYRGGGYERTLSLCGWFVEKSLRNYGDAIADIWVIAHFRPTTPVAAGLESAFDMFEQFLTTLPKRRFSRKHRSLELNAVTDFLVPSGRNYEVTPSLFANGMHEVVRLLDLATSRLTPRDDFDKATFHNDLTKCLESLPIHAQEIDRLRAEQSRRLDQDAASADPWERLGIDWDEYHGSARKLLNDPFLWEQSNDLAPNGNDTGADVLIEYMDWRPQHRRADPMKFLHALLEGWQVNLNVTPKAKASNLAELLERDEFSLNTYDDAIIGLAFACLRVDGKLPAQIASLAVRAVERQSNPIVIEQRGWRDASERARTLQMLTDVLRVYAK